jgi:uncharacterized DUF497 family protein
MDDVQVIWDLEDDPDGNVQHLLEHDVSIEDAEQILLDPRNTTIISRSSGYELTFGWTDDGRHLAVVWEHVQDDPLTIRPITAYETPE